jgi:hypothetical protein
MPAISTTTRSHCIPGLAPATVHCADRPSRDDLHGNLTSDAWPTIAGRVDQP